MKRLLAIILLAAALAAAPAAGQTVKSLGYNTTNGEVVYSGTNPLTFTNPLQFATNARAATRTNLGGTTVGNAVFTATNAAAAATAVGLGTTNTVTFADVTAQIVDAVEFRSSAYNFELFFEGGNAFAQNSNNIFTWTSTNASFPVPVSFSTNVTVTGNATLNGVANLAPAQTAASGDSLMTRDLVGQEFADPRTKMQTTYWFGLEGVGLWQAVNGANATQIGNRGPRWGTSLGIFGNTTNNRSAVTAAGFGLRLGANNITGVGAWRPSDGGAFVLRTRIVNYFGGSSANQAFGFYLGAINNTNFWGNSDAIGIWYVAQPTNAWEADTAFAQHTRIAASNVVFTVSTAGTTTNTAPSFPDLINSLVTNGTAVFRNLGPHTSNNWVLARGSTNASEVLMTNTGKSNWARPTVQEALLKLRYGTNTSAPFTFFATVTDGAGETAEVSIDALTNNSVSPQYWMRWDSTNATVGNDAAGIRYFSIDAELPPLTTP